jgi:hypothetical protein
MNNKHNTDNIQQSVLKATTGSRGSTYSSSPDESTDSDDKFFRA